METDKKFPAYTPDNQLVEVNGILVMCRRTECENFMIPVEVPNDPYSYTACGGGDCGRIIHVGANVSVPEAVTYVQEDQDVPVDSVLWAIEEGYL